MTAPSQPAPRRRDENVSAGKQAHQKQPPPSREARRPSRRVLPRMILLAVTLTLLIGFIALVRTATTGIPGSSASAPAGAQTTSAQTPSRASPVPDFTLATLGGGSFHLAGQRGHVGVLYFLESTCPSCVQESRDLVQALLSAKTAGAQALTIDVSPGDSFSDLEAFVQTVGVPATAPIRWGIDTNGAISSAYGVQNMGTTVVIDAHGRLAYQSNGPGPPAQLAQIVRKLA